MVNRIARTEVEVEVQAAVIVKPEAKIHVLLSADVEALTRIPAVAAEADIEDIRALNHAA